MAKPKRSSLTYPVYDPKTVPVDGQRSSVDRGSLVPGQWMLLENVTGRRRVVTTRWGLTKVGASVPVASASWRGGWIGFLDGIYTRVDAFATASDVRIFSMNLTTYAWTEITGSGTRFVTDAFVEFAAQHDPGSVLWPTGKDVLLCGNGTDTPKVLRRDGSGNLNVVADAAAITFPNTLQPTAQPYPECWFELKNPANVTFNTHTGAFNATPPTNTGGGTDDNEIQVTMDTTATGTLEISFASASQLDSNDYNITTGSGSFDLMDSFGRSSFVGILVQDNIADPVFNYCSVALRDGSTYRDVWNPATTGKTLPLYLPAATGCYLAVFDMSLYRANLDSYINCDRLKMIVDHALTGSRVFNIIGVYGLGAVPAGAQHAVAYTNDSSFAESGSVVCKKLLGPLPRDVGGNKNRNFALPEGVLGANVAWTNIVRIQKPPSGQSVYFYRKDQNDESYFLTGVYQLTNAGTVFGAKHDRIEPAAKFFARKAPSSFNTAPVKGANFTSSGGRMYVAGMAGNQASQVWFSDLGYPLRFTGIPRDDDLNGQVDEDSGGVANFPGEFVKKMVAMPGSVAGIAPVLVFTHIAMWRIEGFDSLTLAAPTRLNPHGTMFPMTVAVHKSNVYYLDSERQPRVYTGGSESFPLGIWKVEDQFESGDCWNSHGVVWKEAYYIWQRYPSETFKRQAIIFEERTGEWWTHRYTSADFSANFVQQMPGTNGAAFSASQGSIFIGISNEGKVYQLETVGKLVDDKPTSGTEAVNITMKTFIQGDDWQNIDWSKPGVIWEKSTGGVLTITLTAAHDSTSGGAVTTGIVTLDDNVSLEAWRYFLSTEGNFPGLQSYGVLFTLTGNPAPGTACRGIVIGRAVGTEGGGADVD